MEDKIIETPNLYSSEGDNLALDVDFYDQDIYDIPDPGVLIEKNGEGNWHYSGTSLGSRRFSSFVQS